MCIFFLFLSSPSFFSFVENHLFFLYPFFSLFSFFLFFACTLYLRHRLWFLYMCKKKKKKNAKNVTEKEKSETISFLYLFTCVVLSSIYNIYFFLLLLLLFLVSFFSSIITKNYASFHQSSPVVPLFIFLSLKKKKKKIITLIIIQTHEAFCGKTKIKGLIFFIYIFFKTIFIIQILGSFVCFFETAKETDEKLPCFCLLYNFFFYDLTIFFITCFCFYFFFSMCRILSI